jgi:prevent-host-death family protein
MSTVGVHQAKTNLSKLLRRVAAGEEIIIMRSGQPIAKLIPLKPAGRRELGVDAGIYTAPEDFDAPLPDEVVASFEG